MSRTRMLIISFWVFIVIMLLWQFYTYNEGLKQASIDHPTQQHFWFTNSASNPAAPVAAPRAGPDIQQTGFTIKNDTPSRGSFTCLVTLTNKGNAKAVGIQIHVRPFRGTSNYDEDVGHQNVIVIDDNNPISQLGQWVTFPDLAPGESGTESVSFLSRSDVRPGKNPQPEILFENEKGQSQTSSPSQAPPKAAPQQRVPGAGG